MTTLPTRHARGAVARGGSRRPGIDADLHGYLLATLDEHLAMLQAIRTDLARATAIRPGERWYAIAGSLVASRRYAGEVTRALRTCTGPVATPDG